MPRIHFLNVGKGDCHIIEHGSGRVTMIDICGGNLDEEESTALANIREIRASFEPSTQPSGDYRMRDRPTNPISYLKRHGISQPFRFILSHPDMDHLDGFDALCKQVGVTNFWDSGLRKTKPGFDGSPYQEKDWDTYASIINKQREGVTVINNIAGAKFAFANEGDPDNHGDCLDIIAPDAALVKAANESEDHNDGSYVIVYRSEGGKIVFPGDAHDGTWEFVIKNYSSNVANCTVLIAPHHGRDSDRSHDFLDTLKPGLSLFGYADSEHLSYDAYNQRDLLHITNNQAGNVVMETSSTGIDIFIENRKFAETFKAFKADRTCCGSFFIGTLTKPAAT